MEKRAPSLVVTGFQCTIWDDNKTAAYLSEEKHLLCWNNDTTLTLDRFDVRMLLDRKQDFMKRRWTSVPDPEAEQLDKERYLDLDAITPAGEAKRETNMMNQGRAAMIAAFAAEQEDTSHIDIKNTEHQQDDDVEKEDNSQMFIPIFQYPSELALPSTALEHERIVSVADFVKKEGGQSEIMLKLHQQNNLKFAFLNEESELHPYYKWLRDHDIDLTTPAVEVTSRAVESSASLPSESGPGTDLPTTEKVVTTDVDEDGERTTLLAERRARAKAFLDAQRVVSDATKNEQKDTNADIKANGIDDDVKEAEGKQHQPADSPLNVVVPAAVDTLMTVPDMPVVEAVGSKRRLPPGLTRQKPPSTMFISSASTVGKVSAEKRVRAENEQASIERPKRKRWKPE